MRFALMAILAGWLATALSVPWSSAQSEVTPAPGDVRSEERQQLQLPGGLDELLAKSGSKQGEPIQFQARYVLKRDSREGVVELTAELAPGWHVYSLTQPEGGPTRSEIKVLTKEVELLGPFKPDVPPTVRFDDVFGMEVEEHSNRVTWLAPVRIAGMDDPSKLEIELRFDGQVCEVSCIPIRNRRIKAVFAGYVDQLPRVLAPSVSIAGAPGGLPEAKQPAHRQAGTGASNGRLRAPVTWRSVLLYLAFGMLGGFLLNFMPCVLPVIGLKILAFVQQAHEDRRQVFLLNVWFSLGIMAVFMALATLPVVFNMSWGQQFTHTWFKVAMIVLVFAMALSFLGVWELTVPGIFGRGKANQLQEKEGAVGAFFKGVFTTILSTPCSGPALGAVFAFIVGQPAVLTYLLFTSIGLGMALPYLVLGAFPRLLRFLPKPGAWMETFKELMGFVLLATTVFLFTTIHSKWFIPTLTLLIGVWFGCWWIGRVPATASALQYIRGWLFAVAASSAVGLFAFTWLAPVDASAGGNSKGTAAHRLPWKPFSRQALQEAIRQQKTVLVDFTAQWCLTCKYNLLTAINTQDVKQVVERNGIVPLLADWTDENKEIEIALRELNANSIPVLAIYPAGRPEDVIVLRDLITKRQLLEALEKAGPSKSDSAGRQLSQPPGQQPASTASLGEASRSTAPQIP